MVDLLRVVGAGLLLVVLLAVLRPQRPELAAVLAAAAGLYLFSLILGRVASVLGLLQEVALRANVNHQYLVPVLKVLGVAYLAEFAAHVARDAGEGAIAAKIELAGKVVILSLAVPIFTAVMDTVVRLLEGRTG